MSQPAYGAPREKCAANDYLALTQRADLGELAGPLVHQFNNFLNSLHLNLAILELDLPSALRSRFAGIRDSSRDVSAIIRQWQSYRKERLVAQAVDLKEILSEVLRSRGRFAAGEGLSLAADVPVRDDLGQEPLPIAGVASDVARLCTFLLSFATGRAASFGGEVSVRAERVGLRVALRVGGTAPALPDDVLHRAFDPRVACREKVESLQLAACVPIVRRMDGALRALNEPAVGTVIAVEFPVYEEKEVPGT